MVYEDRHVTVSVLKIISVTIYQYVRPTTTLTTVVQCVVANSLALDVRDDDCSSVDYCCIDYCCTVARCGEQACCGLEELNARGRER